MGVAEQVVGGGGGGGGSSNVYMHETIARMLRSTMTTKHVEKTTRIRENETEG